VVEVEEWKTINQMGVAPITTVYKYKNYVLSVSIYYGGKGMCPPQKLSSATLYRGRKEIKTWYGGEYTMPEFEEDLRQLCEKLRIPYPFD
jgi:hypothetical protein